MGNISTALERAAKLAAGNDFLTWIAAFFEIYTANGFIVEHLRHKRLKNRLANHGNSRLHFKPVPYFQFNGFSLGHQGAGRSTPHRSCLASSGIKENQICFINIDFSPSRLGARRYKINSTSCQAIQQKIVSRITEFCFCAHDKHRQPFERGGQEITAAHQQDFFRSTLEHDKAGLHSPLGIAKSRKTSLRRFQQHDVLSQLALQEFRGVFANGTDDSEMRQLDTARDLRN